MNANTLSRLFTSGTQLLLFVLVLSVAAGIRPSVAAIDLGQQRQFDIAPQQLSSALLKFSAQSDIQVTVPGQLVEGKESPGVVGKFNPGSALAILLKNTALHYDVVDGSTVVIAGPPDRKLSRNDLQKISSAGTASAPAADGQEIKVAQATATTAQTTASVQNQNTASTASSSSSSDSSLAEIVVTGSSIKTINGETALPVQILKKDDIDRTGATTVEELFRNISAASSSGATTAAQATGIQTGGISTISLRGLGSARTLILINGQRSAVYGGGSVGTAGSAVDVSGIPLAMVERVEVLKDGASAIYGSDAIAGVVNFIMREDYQGLEVSAYDGNPTKGGSSGNAANLSVYGGLGDLKTDRFNIAGGINFEHDKTLLGADRPFATRYSPVYGNDVTSGFAFPANVAVFPANAAPLGKGTQNPFAGNCAPSLNDTNFPSQCRFDNSPYDSLQPDIKKGSANISARYAVTDTSQAYVEGSYSHVEQTTQVQPVPLSYQNPLLPGNPYIAFLANLLATQYPTYHNPAITPTAAAFLLPPSSPYYPTAFATAAGINGQPLNLIYRDFANGPRLQEDTSDSARAVAGYKGSVGTWDYDGAFLYSEVKVKEDLKSGFALYSKIMPLLDGGTINPFGATTDPSAIAAAKADEFTGNDFTSKTSITSFSAKATGELYSLPAGPLSAAVGAEIRRETFEYDPAAAIATGDVTGEGGNQLPENAARNVESAYLEFNAQLLSSLQADAAVRYDNYQRVGNTVNPKFSLRYQPIHAVLLRASAGTGFRAPSLTDLYAAQATSVTSNGTRDPILCPKFDPTNPNCSFQFSTVTGGNPNLTPEKSKSVTFGISIEPVPNLTMDFDSFWIFLRNQIALGGLGYPFILQNAATATQYANLINRDPVTGQIISISQTNANLFKSNVSGLDSDVRYHFDVTDEDRITLLANSTYFYRYVSQNADGSWTGDLDKGLTSVGGVISRFRGSSTLEYQRNNLFNVSLTGNFQKRYHDSSGNITGENRFVSAYETLDAQASFIGLKNFKFTLGGLNILNKNPPYANYAASANNFIGGYDISYGNPLGSFIYGKVVYSFH
jgi:iron complex outermembrane recepter protein